MADNTDDQPDKPAAHGIEVPYERVLVKAIDKLTSEIFLFLLAYVIVLVGVAYLAPALSREYRVLFYGLPVLGLAAHLFSTRRNLRKQVATEAVRVRSFLAADKARVRGVVGTAEAGSGGVRVDSGFALGGAEVSGIVIGGGDERAVDESYMLELFRSLDEAGRREAVRAISELKDKRKERTRRPKR